MRRCTATHTHWLAAVTAVCLLTGCIGSCGGEDARRASPAATPSPAAADRPGAIEGRLGFPSLINPALRVYAIRVGPGSPPWYRQDTARRQVSYVLSPVSAGTYTLVAYEVVGQYGGQARVGGYTAAVVCGLKPTCTDHATVTVTVRPGETATGIDISDFAAPAGTFPPEPGTPR